MSNELMILISTAAFLGLTHTLMGPDHYVPFIAMAKVRNWSLTKTSLITFLCGIGHVGSSVAIGAIGIAAGITIDLLELTESVRGEVAAWLLTAFGLLYLIWGIRRAVLNRPHTHSHAHLDGHEHEHEHTHKSGHVHPHGKDRKTMTAWVLFIIFLFGPCEPLIPLLMFPAARQSVFGIVVVSAVFAVATIGTMMAVVLASSFGLSFVPIRRLARYSHAIAGAAVLACGVGIHLGL